MTKSTRRSALAMLGLMPATAAAAYSVDAMLDKGGDGDDIGIPLTVDSGRGCSDALRRLADAIDRDEALVDNLDMVTSAPAGEIVRHTLSVRFAYKT